MAAQERMVAQCPVTGACLAAYVQVSGAIVDAGCSRCCSNRDAGCHDGVKVLSA